MTTPVLDLAGPPRIISMRVEQAHAHVRVTVWIGQEGHPGKVGELLMRPEDWFDLRASLVHGIKAGTVKIRFTTGTEPWLRSEWAQAKARQVRS